MTDYVSDAESAARNLHAQENASNGLKGLVADVREYLVYCVELLGSGRPQDAPNFSALISATEGGKNYKALTDTSDKSTLAIAYNKNVAHVADVAQQLVDRQHHVGGRVSDVAAIAQSTSQTIEGRISTLQSALDNPQLPAPPRHDYSAEGAMIDACFTAVGNVDSDLQDANSAIQRPADFIANQALPVVPAGGTVTRSVPSYGPVTYGAPLSPSALQAMVSGATDTTKQSFLSAALHKIGDPYVWGAEGPNAFDCSGLVQFSAEQAGIKGMPRTSQEQYAATIKHPVSLNNLQPGDLVFSEFGAGGPGHVMIYAGDGNVVEAPHTGDVVKLYPVSQLTGHIEATRI
ncbi:cell wall-associated NlpC family hydrolase [Nocardia sp. GAS34]|uniref:C40 family peptidase n=1 Tax=unclassified Nocardia TaxID=2637762 RepID=UPI003D2234EE